MNNKVKLEVGKTYYPKKQQNAASDSVIRGQGWKVKKLTDRYIFEFLAARHGGGVDQYELTKEEFTKVQNGSLSFNDLIDLTDRNPNRRPIKTT